MTGQGMQTLGGEGCSLPPNRPLLRLPLPTVCCILSKAVAKAASGAPRQQSHPAPGRLLLSMAGYLSESDFVMVEEGFSTRDLLEELTLGASETTTVREWEWGCGSSGRSPPPCSNLLLGT